ncbi:MAG: GxxExxY protein [Anaerolineales bacterium]|nr:GxxExxY protein [Anaerolineales bacterium]
MSQLIYKDEVYAIVGAAMEVHTILGTGFLEPVYQEAMEIECASRSIPFVPQKILQVHYKQHILKKEYIADMICFEKIIVEFKALDSLTGRESSQVINYLKATGYKVGVLINFGSHPKLEWKRFVV